MASSHWIPEDDFRLRKSIENGASLESLAKGAVKFSRRFTLLELTDRWRYLLYNPQVTSLSSSVGFDLEYSDHFLPQQHHNHQQRTRVRTQFYTARKRMRLEEPPLNDHAIDLAFGENVFDGSSTFLDLQFDEADLAIIQQSFPDIMNQLDGDDDGIVDQYFNDGLIQDCDDDVTATAAEIEQALLQDEFQEPNTSLNETTTTAPVPHSEQEETPIGPESCQDLPRKEEEHCRNATSSLSKLDPHPEIKNGVIICVLNCESDEIPNNDHLTPRQLNNPKPRSNSMNPSSSSSRKHTKPPLPPTRGSSFSQARGNNNIIHRDGPVTTQASFAEKATSSAATTSASSQRHSPENVICEQPLRTEMDIDAPMLVEEENHIEIESDEDLPSYSDVEAMVLDMDLEPIYQDRYELEARRYRTDEIVRHIIRLEKSAASYMNRNIASRGAFAILYGTSKHYINKPEVLLGRATGEYPVDIDLGRSGSELKVSRRQALITLKHDGSFEIKNLGKFSIWMNEKEIKHKEVVHLKNNSLIQIREMSFIFEVNEKEVKRYLGGINR
ncbi:unnamed protein product [Microthlaspi erraticum]|uniref:FHA domain-containing protein n=1 Tax=Microthlaspi erraticum TaxID=1685480 RepID=A0A6D2JZR3_9BRAS|nr:unnamed protein product [Microthlaspi erraticum]